MRILPCVTAPRQEPRELRHDDEHRCFRHSSHEGTLVFKCTLDAGERYDGIRLEIPNSTAPPIALERDGDYWREPYGTGEGQTEQVSYTTAGVFKVVAYASGQGVVGETDLIYVLPKNISVDDYLGMLEDLLNTHQALVESPTWSTVGISIDTTKSFETCPLDMAIDLVAKARAVRHHPRATLSKSYVKVPSARIRRFDGATMRSLAKSSGAWADVVHYSDSPDIFENRAIKTALLRVANRLREMKNALLQEVESLNSRPRRTSADADEQSYLERLEAADETMRSAHEGKLCELEEALALINAELDEDWYDRIDESGVLLPPRPTQIFVRDARYHALYSLICEILEHDIRFSPSFDTSAFGVRSTWQVYEHWCFVKMLQRLLALGFEFDGAVGRDAYENLKRSLAIQLDRAPTPARRDPIVLEFKKSTKSCVKKDGKRKPPFECSDDTMHLTFVYQGELAVRIGEHEQFEKSPSNPDFMFILRYEKSQDRTYVVIADAKYRGFNEDSLLSEIKSTAIGKYIYRADVSSVIGTSNDIGSGSSPILAGSFVIHPIESSKLSGEKGPEWWVFGGSSAHRIADNVSIAQDVAEKFRIDMAATRNLAEYDAPVHNSSVWNTRPFRYGAIQATPSTLGTDEDGLEILFQLLFQYYPYYYSNGNVRSMTCWHCGEAGEEDEAKVDSLRQQGIVNQGKRHWVCGSCKRRWSFSFCGQGCKKDSIVNNFKPSFGIRPHSCDGDWQMQCPICGNQYRRPSSGYVGPG